MKEKFSVVAMAICLLTMLVLGGCAELAMSKMINSPEVKKAVTDLLETSTKTWDGEVRINDPRVEVKYFTGVSIELVGFDGKIGIRGAAPPVVVPLRAPE